MDETLSARKRIGLVAHDNKKDDLLEWAVYNRRLLAAHELIATDTTGTLLEEELGVGVLKLISSPLMRSDYSRALPDYQAHVDRLVRA